MVNFFKLFSHIFPMQSAIPKPFDLIKSLPLDFKTKGTIITIRDDIGAMLTDFTSNLTNGDVKPLDLFMVISFMYLSNEVDSGESHEYRNDIGPLVEMIVGSNETTLGKQPWFNFMTKDIFTTNLWNKMEASPAQMWYNCCLLMSRAVFRPLYWSTISKEIVTEEFIKKDCEALIAAIDKQSEMNEKTEKERQSLEGFTFKSLLTRIKSSLNPEFNDDFVGYGENFDGQMYEVIENLRIWISTCLRGFVALQINPSWNLQYGNLISVCFQTMLTNIFHIDPYSNFKHMLETVVEEKGNVDEICRLQCSYLDYLAYSEVNPFEKFDVASAKVEKLTDALKNENNKQQQEQIESEIKELKETLSKDPETNDDVRMLKLFVEVHETFDKEDDKMDVVDEPKKSKGVKDVIIIEESDPDDTDEDDAGVKGNHSSESESDAEESGAVEMVDEFKAEHRVDIIKFISKYIVSNNLKYLKLYADVLRCGFETLLSSNGIFSIFVLEVVEKWVTTEPPQIVPFLPEKTKEIQDILGLDDVKKKDSDDESESDDDDDDAKEGITERDPIIVLFEAFRQLANRTSLISNRLMNSVNGGLDKLKSCGDELLTKDVRQFLDIIDGNPEKVGNSKQVKTKIEQLKKLGVESSELKEIYTRELSSHLLSAIDVSYRVNLNTYGLSDQTITQDTKAIIVKEQNRIAVNFYTLVFGAILDPQIIGSDTFYSLAYLILIKRQIEFESDQAKIDDMPAYYKMVPGLIVEYIDKLIDIIRGILAIKTDAVKDTYTIEVKKSLQSEFNKVFAKFVEDFDGRFAFQLFDGLNDDEKKLDVVDVEITEKIDGKDVKFVEKFVVDNMDDVVLDEKSTVETFRDGVRTFVNNYAPFHEKSAYSDKVVGITMALVASPDTFDASEVSEIVDHVVKSRPKEKTPLISIESMITLLSNKEMYDIMQIRQLLERVSINRQEELRAGFSENKPHEMHVVETGKRKLVSSSDTFKTLKEDETTKKMEKTDGSVEYGCGSVSDSVTVEALPPLFLKSIGIYNSIKTPNASQVTTKGDLITLFELNRNLSFVGHKHMVVDVNRWGAVALSLNVNEQASIFHYGKLVLNDKSRSKDGNVIDLFMDAPLYFDNVESIEIRKRVLSARLFYYLCKFKRLKRLVIKDCAAVTGETDMVLDDVRITTSHLTLERIDLGRAAHWFNFKEVESLVVDGCYNENVTATKVQFEKIQALSLMNLDLGFSGIVLLDGKYTLKQFVAYNVMEEILANLNNHNPKFETLANYQIYYFKFENYVQHQGSHRKLAPPTKTSTTSSVVSPSWDRFVGKDAAIVKANLSELYPQLKIVIVSPDGVLTTDYRLDRLRLFVDPKSGLIVKIPKLG